MSFLGEIKRRKVFQVAAVYAVMAWLVIQVIDVVSEPLSLPDWLDTVVIVLLAAGFPIAVVLAWAFDLTPRGIESDSEVQTAGASPPLQGQSISLVIQGLVLLAVAVLVLDQYLLEPRSNSLEGAPMSAVAEAQVNRFDYTLPAGQFFRDTATQVMALSPDGRHFVYNTEDGLYLRTMGELEARLIPGTEPYLHSMVFSPDGQSLAYLEDTEGAILKRIAINGSAAVTIGEPEDSLFQGMSWQPDDTILYGRADGIYRVSANGGRHELIIPLENPDHYGAELLPNGDSVLFSITSNLDWEAAQIVIQSLSTGERTVLVEGGSDARYLPTGHLIYAFGDGLFARAFDLDTLTVSGGAVPLVQGLMRVSGTSGAANYSVSDDGTLVYVPSTAAVASRTLVWVNREGRETPINAPPRNYIYARISPDGTKVALEVRDQEFDIWTWDLVRETPLKRLTFDPGRDRFPVWSPDSQRIAYQSHRREGSDQVLALDWQVADGAGAPVRLAENLGLFPTSFLPDATGILLSDDDIGVFRMEGEDRATLLLETRFQERNPEISPDGRWLAYASNASGTEEIYVRPFPDIDAGRWQVSTGGGTQPLWARDGQELLYRDGDAMMAVQIEADPTFAHGNPELIFEGEYAASFGGRTYDVSRDGERFLMMKDVEATSATPHIIVVQNWFEELGRLVPAE